MNTHHNAHWADTRPILSILIPFLRDDPTILLEDIAHEAITHSGRIEVIVLDDGTDDKDLTLGLRKLLDQSPFAATLLTPALNLGRARGRNRLAEAARGEYLLFLDADMRPDSSTFTSRWIEIATQQQPAVCFGGFTLLLASDDPRYRVHQAMAGKTDCLNAKIRQKQPEKHIFTSNLLIRRDVFSANPFDDRFTGWGWEDVEWAMRVASEHPLSHADNTASHLGLDTVEDLMRKYRQSAPNFARIAARHPHFVSQYSSYKVAHWLARFKAASLVLFASEKAALSKLLPVPMRALALRFYRAALYAKAIVI